MKIHKPPANDAERLDNLKAGLALLDAEDDQTDDEFRAEAEAAGIDFDAWAAEMRAKVAAHGAAARRANDVEPEGHEDGGPDPQRPLGARKARWPLLVALTAVSLTGLATLALRWATPRDRRSLPVTTEECAPSIAVPRPAPTLTPSLSRR